MHVRLSAHLGEASEVIEEVSIPMKRAAAVFDDLSVRLIATGSMLAAVGCGLGQTTVRAGGEAANRQERLIPESSCLESWPLDRAPPPEPVQIARACTATLSVKPCVRLLGRSKKELVDCMVSCSIRVLSMRPSVLEREAQACADRITVSPAATPVCTFALPPDSPLVASSMQQDCDKRCGELARVSTPGKDR